MKTVGQSLTLFIKNDAKIYKNKQNRFSKPPINKRFQACLLDVGKPPHRLDGGKMIDIKIVDSDGRTL